MNHNMIIYRRLNPRLQVQVGDLPCTHGRYGFKPVTLA